MVASYKLRTGTPGTCPVCQGEYKVRAGVMVHHGFRRPGNGSIHGDCFGVGLKPYEVSSEGCTAYRGACEARREELKVFLGQIPERHHWSELHVRSWGVYTLHYAIGVTDRYVWDRLVETKTRHIEWQIRDLGLEIARMTVLIDAWTPKPLREVTEEAATAELENARAARKAERDAKNAAKAEKAAALARKRAERESRRTAALVAFVAELESLRGVEKTEQEKLATAAWRTFFSKKTARAIGDNALVDCYYDLRRLGHEPLLVEVGLAVQVDGRVDYRCRPSW